MTKENVTGAGPDNLCNSKPVKIPIGSPCLLCSMLADSPVLTIMPGTQQASSEDLLKGGREGERERRREEIVPVFSKVIAMT